VIYHYTCLDCGREIAEKHGASNNHSRLRPQLCVACCRRAIAQSEDWMEGTVDGLLAENRARDGEPLAAAIEDARKKSLEFRRQASELAAKAEQWEEVVRQLEAAQSLSRQTSFSRPQPQPAIGDPPQTGARRPHGFWRAAVLDALDKWNDKFSLGRGPTKGELTRFMLTLHEEKMEYAQLYHAVNKAVVAGDVDYRVDHLYRKKEQAA